MASVRDEILEIEKRFWDVGPDPGFYQKVLDDKALMVMEPMGVIKKSDVVGMADKADAWDDVKLQDVNVVELTPDCVGIAYHGEGKNRSTGKPYRASISSVYTRRNGDWKLAMSTHQPWEPEAHTRGKE
jgi:hypothetical protein